MILKKYKKALLIVLLIILFGIILAILNGNFSKKTSSSNEISKNIENDIPKKIDIPADESGENIESVDNKEIDKRYQNINKGNLTYETTMEDLDKSYFYEFKNGLALKRADNTDLKPINNEKYAKVLLGYSYSRLDKPFTKNQVLDKVNSILPYNSKEVSKKKFDDYELIKYNTSKGNFIVCLGYKIITDELGAFAKLDKDNIQDIYYFKEIQ